MPGFYLPVPDIRDDVIVQHSRKQANKSRRDDTLMLKPPKLKPRYHDNISNRSITSTSANAISFREHTSNNVNSGLSDVLLSSVYNRSSEETYFEQCFDGIAKIGEGSFGEVFKVRSKEDGLLYAVKKSKQLFRSENYRQERLEEVKRYEQFSDHENCVRLYKAWEQDDRLYMQMELCRESLDQYLERNKQIPEEKIWSTLLDLLLAVKSLHDKNLIHLDIKLDNILIGDDGICKLADFGLVIDVNRASRQEATEGDSRYIAPELMQGHFTKAADIFSLGITILEMSCYLELPLNGRLWQELRSGMLPEDFIKSVSKELQVMIKSMMTPDPARRPTVDQLLSHKRLVVLLQRRRRWDVVKKFKQKFRKVKRFVSSKICTIKSLIYQFFACVLASLRLQEPDSQQMLCTNIKVKESTPVVNKKILGSMIEINNFPGRLVDNCFDVSYHGTPSNFTIDKIVNSTPLNHTQHSFRSRKDLTKTSFRIDLSDQNSRDSSTNLLCLDDYDIRSNSFGRSLLDTSLLRRKKLFLRTDEIDSD